MTAFFETSLSAAGRRIQWAPLPLRRIPFNWILKNPLNTTHLFAIILFFSHSHPMECLPPHWLCLTRGCNAYNLGVFNFLSLSLFISSFIRSTFLCKSHTCVWWFGIPSWSNRNTKQNRWKTKCRLNEDFSLETIIGDAVTKCIHRFTLAESVELQFYFMFIYLSHCFVPFRSEWNKMRRVSICNECSIWIWLGWHAFVFALALARFGRTSVWWFVISHMEIMM